MKQTSFLTWIWRMAIVGFGLYGLYLQLFPDDFYNLTYYTLISNILVVVFWIYLLFLMAKNKVSKLTSPKIVRLKGAFTMAIILTFLVYMILLAPIAEPKDFYNWKNYTLHYIVPIMTIIDWLMLDPKNQYRKSEPFIWTLIPLLYMAFSLIKGYVFNIEIPDQKHSPYPYFFMNINNIGWDGFLKYAIAIFIFYVVLGYILYFVKTRKKGK